MRQGELEIQYEPDDDQGTIIVHRAEGGEPIRQTICFQHGLISGEGPNGIFNEHLLELLIIRLRVLNARLPCREGSLAITKVEEALLWLNRRTQLREEQHVENTYMPHAS